MQNFKRSGTSTGSEFNYYDTTGHKYFKIIFYFGKDTLTTKNLAAFGSGGLLTPTWNEFIKDEEKKSLGVLLDAAVNKLTKNKAEETSYIYSEAKDSDNFYKYNSAWGYLMLNDELQRAKHLEEFVNLLSNINSESPWYFSEIEGISEALTRQPASDGKFEFGERKKLTIKCLPDAFDNRITTLLDLYRDVVWSWNMKREILPSNLRKFDMGIYIFESPILDWHENGDTIDGRNGYKPSYKLLEFHNCEFDYNSIKSGWGTLNNKSGFNPEYSIEISYDDCYEVSYNEFMMHKLGDVILTDFIDTTLSSNPVISKADLDDDVDSTLPEGAKNRTKQLAGLNKRANPYDKGLLGNAVNQLVSTGVNYLEDKLERALLGNLHTYSLTNMASQVKTAMQGGVIQTVQAAGDYIDSAKKRKENVHKTAPTGNITNDKIIERDAEFDDATDNGAKGNLNYNRQIERDVEFDDATDNGAKGNLYKESVEFSKEQPNGTIYTKTEFKKQIATGNITAQQIAALKMKQKPAGNIFSGVTLVNNI